MAGAISGGSRVRLEDRACLNDSLPVVLDSWRTTLSVHLLRSCLDWLCSMLTAVNVGAQTTNLPSEVDLTAAYCLGVVLRQTHAADQLAAKVETHDAPEQELHRRHQRELQEQLRRVQAYLVPKATSPDLRKLAEYQARGNTDFEALTGLTKRASEDCRPANGILLNECAETKVRASDLWQRVDRCRRLDLPV